MLPIKNNKEEEVFIHIDKLSQYIAEKLNLHAKKITLLTQQKSVVALESNNYQHKAFDKLSVFLKDNVDTLQYEFNEKDLTLLIAKNLMIDPDSIALKFVCNIKPGSNGSSELNYIGVVNKNPEVKLSVDTTFNKIQQIRQKYIINNEKTNNNINL